MPAASRIATAESYPSRPVRIIVGLPPGLSPDIGARLIGQGLSKRFGQPVVIENRPGASTNLAVEAVVRAPPDGYTLLLALATNAINGLLYAKLAFDFVKDIAPVATINRNPFVMAVAPAFPAKTFPEFIAYAKANPGKVNMASPGNGTAPHLCGELLKMMTGIDLVHVPYRSSYMPDLLGGQVQVAFTGVSEAIGYVRAGKLRALGVATATRLQVLPDTPTIGESVPGYEASGWWGVGAPKDTPVAIIETLNKNINAVVAEPAVKARLLDLGVEPMSMTSAEFSTLIADETKKWAKVIRFAGIKPE